MPRKKFPHLKLVDPTTLPELVIHHNNPNVTAKALARLIAPQDNIFRRQSEPARLDLDENGEPKLVVLDFMDVVELGYELTNPVKQTRDGRCSARIPHDVGKLALKKLQSTETALRPLDGFCTMPILKDDGTINAAHGYHEPTRLYCHRLPDIVVPECPTRTDAEAALLQLRHAFRTLPYADADMITEKVMAGHQPTALRVVDLAKGPARDESGFLTMLVTSVCRSSLTLAPALGLTSPKFSGAGTGKGLSIRVISIIATGKSTHVNSVGRGTEMEKGIVAALLQPDPIISLDNLNNVLLLSAALCTALTETPARLRPLGSSENREINTRAFIALNGNALRIGEDLVRRVVVVELDAKVENPELRSFPGDFLKEITEARPQLLVAILTIWRWGRRNHDQLKRGLPLGSFSQWSEWVRDTLITLGCCDPVERVETAKANDADRLYTLGIFEAWEEQFGAEEKTSKDAYDNEKVRAAVEGAQQLTRQKFATKLSSLIGVRLGGYLMESPNKAEKERPENKKRLRFVPYTYRLMSPPRYRDDGERDVVISDTAEPPLAEDVTAAADADDWWFNKEPAPQDEPLQRPPDPFDPEFAVRVWKNAFAPLQPQRKPCPGWRAGEWSRAHADIRQFLNGPLALAAAKVGWSALDLFACHKTAGVTASHFTGALIGNVNGGFVVRVEPDGTIRFTNNIAARKRDLDVALCVPIWNFCKASKDSNQRERRTDFQDRRRVQ
jgi:hypothetical protein